MKKRKYDFAGWVTKNDIRCSDGVTIKHGAFKGNDGGTVPLVWQHDVKDPTNVLGHVQLENKDSGVYGYGYFNNSEYANQAKELIKHGDINALSIHANKLQKRGNDVLHGVIREVSLVLSGANPGAVIEYVMSHSDSEESEEAIIYLDQIIHSADSLPPEDEEFEEEQEIEEEKGMPTIEEVLDTLNEEQMDAVETLIGALADEGYGEYDEGYDEYDEEGDGPMKHNLFQDNEGNEYYGGTITHSEQMDILEDARALGSLQDAFIQHGITNIDILFPDATAVSNIPTKITDTHTGYKAIMNAVGRVPFSKIKNLYADLTEEEARAKGYIKGEEKLEQYFEVFKRETSPQTIYKKQQLDRDDIIDITDFDVVNFINSEMREKLEEEIARAVLVGDGRNVISKDKIKETNIRPIINDHNIYTIKATCEGIEDLIEAVIRTKVEYRGSGMPTVYLHPYTMAKLKLMKDSVGRYLWDDTSKLAARMGVAGFQETTFMPENTIIIVNLNDYKIGTNKGGQITTFDDFDIDFNQYKYLIETRISGALVEPKSAIRITINEVEDFGMKVQITKQPNEGETP